MTDVKANTSPSHSRRGLMLVLSSPSGAGKTTLSRKLLEKDAEVSMSISATTRSPRPGEEDGKDYIFVSKEQFSEMQEENVFLESATVFDNKYGTPKGPVDAALEAGRDVLFDIDWQGTQQLAERRPNDLVRIFILPPDAEELEKRLTERAQDTADVVAGRMAKASDEISHWAEYDYVLINEDLEMCSDEIYAILKAERLRRERRSDITHFVRDIQSKLK
jgi:guanylate kinase